MQKYLVLTLLSFLSVTGIKAQDDLEALLEDNENAGRPVEASFKTTRIINAHSVELVKKHHLDIRISHRFGDIAGTAGGFHTLYGFDNVTDVRIAGEFGITEHFTAGFGRSKGGGAIREVWDVYGKYRLLNQTSDNKKPVTFVLVANTNFSTMKPSPDLTSAASFQKWQHRLSYTIQALIARKFNNWLTFQVMPAYVYRNYVAFDDENDLLAIGVGGRAKLTKRFGIIADYFYVFRERNIINDMRVYNPLAIGIEIETGGHVFHLNFTNSTSINANQFMPSTTSNWADGQFRFGFNISRIFVL